MKPLSHLSSIFCPSSVSIPILIALFVNVCHSEGDNLSLIRKCYDSPSDLFQIYPQLNQTFKIKVKNKCLQLTSFEIYLFVFDLSIIDQIQMKEVDQLDPTKLNSIRINRPVMNIGPTDLSNFKINSKFKFALVFYDHAGVADLALHPKAFHFYTNNQNSSTAEIFLIFVLGVLLLITCTLLVMLIYINYFGNARLQNYMIFWRNSSSRRLIKSRLLGEDETTREITFEPKSNVILVDGLTERITTMMEEESIKNEYNSVPKLKLHSWSYARLPEHKTKNRYGNLLPYDHSRVVLKKDSPTDSDYINANFIDGFRKTNRYIAMQGPIDATINDFWRCVWQFKCHQIVVLTNLEENGKSKCDKYWPDISQHYGKIKVILQKTELFADYIIRNFLVEKDGEKLVVVQYHFLTWPDHMAPVYACTLISFINRIRSSPLYKENNCMVVHCSAGIGRTGAFILIDSMLQMAKKERKIDVLGHFCKMRLQRINMVELSQYIFVYQVLFEALSHDSTDISCNDFASYLEKLIRANDKGTSILYKQYELLNNMSLRQLSAEVCKFGIQNFKFNRRQDVVPPDYARVILPQVDDYINAVYVNGYRKQDAYIVTQIPFENDRERFWKMIECTGSSSIILLSETDSDELIYWPTMANKKMLLNNEMVVVLQKEEMSNNITIRTFLIKPQDLIVRQFQLQGLIGHHFKPTSPYLMIELREKLDQYNIGGTTPMVVQCLDGVQYSGIFAAADFIFERIKEEQQIDVFLAVQKIRTNRPQFIGNYDQYLYLHQIAQAYLQSFDQYANFK